MKDKPKTTRKTPGSKDAASLQAIPERLTKAQKQLATLRVKSDKELMSDVGRNQMSIYLRMLLNCTGYQEKIASDIESSPDKNGDGFNKLVRLFWRQVTLFDSVLLSAQLLLKGEDKMPSAVDYLSVIDDLMVRAENAEEAYNKVEQNKKTQQNVEVLRSALAYLVPFVESVAKSTPGTPMNKKYVDFAKKCVDQGISNLSRK